MRKIATAVLVALTPLPAQDSAAPRPRKLGAFLWHDSPSDLTALEGIRASWKDAGLPFEMILRHADSDAVKARAALAELRASGAELVFALGTQAALFARDEVRDLPVVFTAVTNPVASEIVSSWGPTGTKLCGNSNWIPSETLAHVFRMAIPGLARVGIIRSTGSGVVSAAELASMREYLAKPGAPELEILERVVTSERGIEAAVVELLAERVQAIWIPIDFTIYQNMDLVRAALGKSPVPLLSSSLLGAKTGAITGVLVDYELLGRRAGALAVEILVRGRDPGTLPIGTMRGYQVVVNLEAARAIGYRVPLALLAIADILVGEKERKVPR